MSPKHITLRDGTRLVKCCEKPMRANGETWETYVLDDEDSEDLRIWERSIETGRIIQTQEG